MAGHPATDTTHTTLSTPMLCLRCHGCLYPIQALASTVPPETARNKVDKKIVKGLTDEEVAKINSFQYRLEQEVRNIVDKVGRQATVAERLDPIIGGEDKLSKIVAHTGADKRHINMRQMVALRYVYGLDINKLVDELMNPKSQS